MNLPERTNDEWTVHSINIQGTFFERVCKKIIAEAQGWKVRATNYPVEYPPPNGPWRGKESKLDILAESRTEDIKLTLLVECKKNNPELIDWIFFPVLDNPSSNDPTSITTSYAFLSVTMIENIPDPPPSKIWNTQTSIQRLTKGFKVTNDAIETRGSYLEYIQKNRDTSKLTKTGKSSIEDAAYQVALATQSIIFEEEHYSRVLRDYAVRQQGDTQLLPYKWQVFLPVILTTARLFICKFDPTNIDIARGELPLDKAQIDQYPYLLYQYALPRSLQHTPSDLASVLLDDSLEIFRRMDILVVNSAALGIILSSLGERIETLFFDKS